MAYKIDKNKGGARYANRQIGLTTQDKNPAREIGAPNYEFYELEPAEVIDIILDDTHPDFQTYEDIGKAKIRYIHSEVGKDEALLAWAKPIDSNIKTFPLKHEIVVGIILFSDFYYTQKLNIFNNPNENSYPGASLPDLSRAYKSKRKANEYEDISNSGSPNKQTIIGDVKLGNSFKKSDIKPMLPKEGDIIIEGRFGQSIRLGSNSETQLPNFKLRVGQPDQVPDQALQVIEEDINNDPNSIWISSADEKIELNPATINSNVHLKFYNKTNEFIGNQIFINSDRIVLNTKQNEIMGFAKKAINLVTEGIFTVDSVDRMVLNTNSKIVLNSPEIYLGNDSATEPIVLGETLKNLLEHLIDLLANHTHLTPTGIAAPMVESGLLFQWKSKISSTLSRRNFSL